MVSKVIRKTPTKPTNDRRSNRRRKKSPLKNVVQASSVFFSSINKSIFTCHRRLVKIFSKLANISTPIRRKQQGFQLLQKFPNEEDEKKVLIEVVSPPVRRTLSFKHTPLLPPSFYPEKKKTIFLDLDETLIHSQTDPQPERFDFIVRPSIEGEVMNFYVLKRPGVDEFLESIAENYEIVVFTAGLKEYASLVLDTLDTKRVISYRLYRDSCKEMDGRFVKDLSEIGRDLKNVVLVDDNPNAYVLQPANALPVRPFINNPGDRELQKVKKFFEAADCYEDIRDAVKSFVWEGEHNLEMY